MTIAGHPIEGHKYSGVYYALRGIRKLQGNNFTRPPRSPITLRHLSKLLKHFNRHFLHLDNIMLSAAVLTAFFGLLRVSVDTSKGKRTFDPVCTLMVNDVRFQNKFRFVQTKIAQSVPVVLSRFGQQGRNFARYLRCVVSSERIRSAKDHCLH